MDLFFTTFSPRWLPPMVFKKKVQFYAFLDVAQYRGEFSQKSGKIKLFFNAHWEIWPKNCSKTRKFRKFEQNLGQISHCAYQKPENWTFFSLPFRHDGLHLRFSKKKKKGTILAKFSHRTVPWEIFLQKVPKSSFF